MELNPYQAPDIEIARLRPIGADGQLRREGHLLVTPVKATLPPRCVKCNQPIERPHLRRKLSWHHPLVYLTVGFNLFIYLIVALAVRRQATLYVGLCEAHWATRRRDLAIAWALVVLALALFGIGFSGFNTEFAAAHVAMVVAACLLLLSAAIWAILRCSVIRPKRIDRQSAWIRGVCPEFLAEIEQA